MIPAYLQGVEISFSIFRTLEESLIPGTCKFFICILFVQFDKEGTAMQCNTNQHVCAGSNGHPSLSGIETANP